MEERLKYLFGQYLNNTCSKTELEEFFEYVYRAKHDEVLRSMIRKAYKEVHEKNPTVTYVNESGNLVLNEPEWLSQKLPEPRFRKKAAAIIAIAALALVSIGVGWLMKNKQGNISAIDTKQSLTKKATGRSEYKYLLLPDSTQVWLNAASSLEFPPSFQQNSREVVLVGEAYFDVKHADKIPFIIHTGKVSTKVLGTAFNIKAYPGGNHVIVSVSRGKVSVSYNSELVATLTKGQQVKVGDNRVTEKAIAVTAVAAWQEGNMVYDDENFEDIINDLQRVYNVDIQITNDALRTLKISTSFRQQIGVEQALEILCKLTDKELKQSNGIYIIQ